MTARGAALIVSGALLMALGWSIAWPELTVLGVSALVPVVLSLLFATGGSRFDVRADTAGMTVVRGEEAFVRVELKAAGRRRRLCRLVEGSLREPRRSLFIPPLSRDGKAAVALPLDTSRRGLHPVGPFQVVRSDAWSVVRREVGSSSAGSVLVRPRTFAVRGGFAAVNRQGDSEAMTRTSGDDHFFALRDYTFGDEPRNVHWRSSARSGRLVVKQKVAAAIDGTLLVLDVDSSAFPSVESFGDGFNPDRFEVAVEVMASLAKARLLDGQRLRLVTTSKHEPRPLIEVSLNAILDALAVVEPQQPLDCDPGGLPLIARRSGCSHMLVVSGNPGLELTSALRRCGSMSPVVVRVGGVPTGSIPGTTVLDISDAAALV
jgi:uncharacterized protein (DUF58 family)